VFRALKSVPPPRPPQRQTFSTFSRGTLNKQTFKSTDQLRKDLRNEYFQQGHTINTANTFATQNAESFVEDSPVDKVTVPPGYQTLGIGSDTFKSKSKPTGTYSADYDQLFSSAGRKSPSQLQDSLALPTSNEADTLYRFVAQQEMPQYEGVVAPQGNTGSSVFTRPTSGGGRQIVTPGGVFTTPLGGVNLSLERIAKAKEADGGPPDDIQ
jgi:hypothetical protein